MMCHMFSQLGSNSRNDPVEFVVDLTNQDDQK